jgi:hypothetical protein
MKATVQVFIIVFFMLSSPVLYAQTSIVFNNKTATNKGKIVPVKLFTAKYRGGKSYLHWVIAKGSIDGFYAVYRSGDGISFDLFGFVEGLGSSVCMDISHYIIDDCPNQGTNYYKLLYILEGTPAFSSDVINVEL